MRFSYTSLLLVVPFTLLAAAQNSTRGDAATLSCIGFCFKNATIHSPYAVQACATKASSVTPLSLANATTEVQCYCNQIEVVNTVGPCVDNCSTDAWTLLQKTCLAVGVHVGEDVPDNNAAAMSTLRRGSVLIFATAALAFIAVV